MTFPFTIENVRALGKERKPEVGSYFLVVIGMAV